MRSAMGSSAGGAGTVLNIARLTAEFLSRLERAGGGRGWRSCRDRLCRGAQLVRGAHDEERSARAALGEARGLRERGVFRAVGEARRVAVLLPDEPRLFRL